MEADRTCILLQKEASTNLRMARMMRDRSRLLRDSNQTAKRPNTLHGSQLELLLLLLLLVIVLL
jgi:hypothetical protein